MIKRIIWKTFHLGYTTIAKPLLFLISPDKAHSMMIGATSAIGHVVFARWLVRAVFGSRRHDILSQKHHGVDFKNPVGVSAGFDKNGEIIPMLAALDFGFVTVGSVTAFECDGNPRPWYYRLPKTQSLVVNAGLANHGSKAILKRIHDYSNSAVGKFPITLSVAKTNSQKVVSVNDGIKDYILTIIRAKNEPRIKMIEINISCPNAFGGEPFTTPERLKLLLDAVDKIKVNKPIYVKMPVDLSWVEFKKLLDVIVKHRIAGVTIANLHKNRSTVDFKDHLPDTVKGNLSGKPTEENGNKLIRQTYINYGDKLTIIGVGGIFTAQDAYTKIKLGASLVEVITGVIFCGPQLAAEINYDLVQLLKRDGYEHISQAIGINAR
jgi:dihydroorotate dehydrogenase (fumarate)